MNTDEFLKDSVQIDTLQLQEEYTELPAQLAYWNEQYAKALREYLHAKIARVRLHAKLYFEKRAALSGKVTEASVDAAIETDPRYCNSRDEEADAEAEATRLRGVVESVRTKKDMLVSLGAHIRAEMVGDPSVRRRHRDEHLQGTEFETPVD